MKKYTIVLLTTILILLILWNISDFAEEPKITYNGIVEEEESYQTDILLEADGEEIIMPKKDSIIESDTRVIMDDKTEEAYSAGQEQKQEFQVCREYYRHLW